MKAILNSKSLRPFISTLHMHFTRCFLRIVYIRCTGKLRTKPLTLSVSATLDTPTAIINSWNYNSYRVIERNRARERERENYETLAQKKEQLYGDNRCNGTLFGELTPPFWRYSMLEGKPFVSSIPFTLNNSQAFRLRFSLLPHAIGREFGIFHAF